MALPALNDVYQACMNDDKERIKKYNESAIEFSKSNNLHSLSEYYLNDKSIKEMDNIFDDTKSYNWMELHPIFSLMLSCKLVELESGQSHDTLKELLKILSEFVSC